MWKLVPTVALFIIELTRDKRMLATTATDNDQSSLYTSKQTQKVSNSCNDIILLLVH